jgi:GR25 family glycosyltransferase involved in LPS biosynthesis
MTKPVSYVITLQGKDHTNPYALGNYKLSQRLSLQVLDSASTHNWHTEIFPATDGYKITDQDWKNIGVEMLLDRGKMQYRLGAQGCFISHFRLWQLCLEKQQPIVVLEHDAIIQAPWPDLTCEHAVIKLHQPLAFKENTLTGKWSKGAYAYFLHPTYAQILINAARKLGAQALDKMIADRVVPVEHLNYNLVTRSNSGSTTAKRIT